MMLPTQRRAGLHAYALATFTEEPPKFDWEEPPPTVKRQLGDVVAERFKESMTKLSLFKSSEQVKREKAFYKKQTEQLAKIKLMAASEGLALDYVDPAKVKPAEPEAAEIKF